jgi:hypothetical protein
MAFQNKSLGDSWVPRALASQTSEFNVPEGKADSKAAAAGSASAGEKRESSEAGADAKRAKSGEDEAARDQVAEGAPRLAEHIKSASKFAKVSAMAVSLLEDGRVTKHNSEAFFQVLAAAVEEPKHIRVRELRPHYRRLFAAAFHRQGLFQLPRQQAMIKVWQMRVINQIDLFTTNAEDFNRVAKQVRMGILLLPCQNPMDEPPSVRVHMPPNSRDVWADALFECLEVAMKLHAQSWAQAEVNMLIKAAHDRRQNFREAQRKTLMEYEMKRRGTARGEALLPMGKQHQS